jgi:hypothetical protein
MRILNLLVGLTILHSTSLHAEGMKPLSSIHIDVLNQNADPVEVGFMGVRCGVLFTVFGGYIQENGTKRENKELANGLIKKGQEFSFSGVYIDTNTNKKTNEAVKQQYKALSDAYIAEMLSGKRLNNSIATPLVSSDVDACNRVYPFYSALTKKLGGIK